MNSYLTVIGILVLVTVIVYMVLSEGAIMRSAPLRNYSATPVSRTP